MANKVSTVTEDGIKQLDGAALTVLGKNSLQGFQKAYLLGEAVANLESLLTTEYMAPIMKLQGNSLGFKTDKDKDGGYKEDVVKRCLIEAVLKGLQPVGNQFNIIAGNMYPTKEGCGELLKKIEGLSYKITPALPQVNAAKTGAAVKVKIEHTYNGRTQVDEPEFPIITNQYSSVDAIIGKATRKARMWLYNYITGSDLVDGEVTDVDAKVMSSKLKTEEVDHERERWQHLIDDCKKPAELMVYKESIPEAYYDIYEAKLATFLD